MAPNDDKRNAKLGLDPSFIAPSQKQGPEENLDDIKTGHHVLDEIMDNTQPIEEVNSDELQDEGGLDTENIIGPDGEKEQWKMVD